MNINLTLNIFDPEFAINRNQHFPKWNAETFNSGAPTFAAATALDEA